MKYKPLVFRILSVFFMIEPLIKVLYFKALTHFDFSQIFDNLFSHHSLRDIFDFWLVFPLAGLMLLRLRKWTYFGFLALIGYLFFSIMTYERYTWPYNSSSPLFLSLRSGVSLLSPSLLTFSFQKYANPSLIESFVGGKQSLVTRPSFPALFQFATSLLKHKSSIFP